MPRSKWPFLETCVQICSSMAESYPFSSELFPYGPSIAICSSLRHSSPYLIRFAHLRIHELNRTFAWCASAKMAMSKDMRANMQQHGRILPFVVRIAPIWPQNHHMQQPAAFQPLSYQTCTSADTCVKSDICMVCLSQNCYF